MSTHNTFSSRNKKNIDTFWFKKVPYQELSMCIIINLEALIWMYVYYSKTRLNKICKPTCQQFMALDKSAIQGPVVQSIVSLTSSLVVKMLTVL